MLNLPGFLIEPKSLAIPPQTKDLFVYVKQNECLIHSWFYMATRLLLGSKQLNAIERLFRIFCKFTIWCLTEVWEKQYLLKLTGVIIKLEISKIAGNLVFLLLIFSLRCPRNENVDDVNLEVTIILAEIYFYFKHHPFNFD